MIPKSAVDTARKLAALTARAQEGQVASEADRYKACAGAALAFLATCEVYRVPPEHMGQFLTDGSRALAQWPADGGA